MKLGITFDENLYGTFQPVGRPADRRPLMYRLRARAESLPRALLWDRTLSLDGWVDAEGLARHAPVAGTLVVEPILRRRMIYTLGFTAADGRALRFRGTKTIRHLRPIPSWTLVRGTIEDEAGSVRYESEARFDLSELVPFLGSYALVLSRS